MSTPSEKPEVSILLAGLPASGKSTFIAAFWHVVANADEIRFIVRDFSGDREYVQQLEQSWLKALQLPRTPIRAETDIVAIALDDVQEGDRFRLMLPDPSGEKFVQAFVGREWSKDLAPLVDRAEAVLLFVNPNFVVRPTLITDVAGLAQVVEGEDAVEAAEVIAPWEAAQTPTAAVLVDLLAAVLARRSERSELLRVALIVSAWDTLADVGLSPEEWVRRDLALLHQFLVTNRDSLDARIFGVSAQGGDVTDPEIRKELLDKNPLDRVKVVQGADAGLDFGAPLSWVYRR